jgi:hypothetical protein
MGDHLGSCVGTMFTICLKISGYVTNLIFFVNSYKLNPSFGAFVPTLEPQSGVFVYGVKSILSKFCETFRFIAQI